MRADAKGAHRFIGERFGNRAQGFAPLAAGEWSQAYALTLDGKDVVIRFGAYRDDFEKDLVMGRHASATLPIPRVLEVGEAPGGYYALSERVRGEPLDHLDERDMQAVLPSLLDLLDALQEVDLTGTRGYGIWLPDGTAPSRTWAEALLSVADPGDRIAGWRERLDTWPDCATVFDAGVQTLRQLAPQVPERRGMAHSDLLNRNVLVESGKIAGVFDWGNALYGDPLYDLAWLLYWWPWYPAWQAIDIRKTLDEHWRKGKGTPPGAEERLLVCQLHIGLSHIAYSAFKEREEDMRRNADQVSSYL
jgi:hygromycin-B 4-O-kinase